MCFVSGQQETLKTLRMSVQRLAECAQKFFFTLKEAGTGSKTHPKHAIFHATCASSWKHHDVQLHLALRPKSLVILHCAIPFHFFKKKGICSILCFTRKSV